MLLLPKYNLDLPVYEAITPVATRGNFDIAAANAIESNPEAPMFVRAAAVCIPLLAGRQNLTRTLRRTDSQLEVFAEQCSAEVLRHRTWGLLPVEEDSEGKFDYYLPRKQTRVQLGIPKNHIIVVEVRALDHPVNVDSPIAGLSHFMAIKRGLDQYRALKQKGLRLADRRPDQVVVSSDLQTRTVVDIEPILERSNFINTY
jgi:hypothetical protein